MTAQPLIRAGVPTSSPERMRLGALVRHIAQELPPLRSCTLRAAGHQIEIRGTCVERVRTSAPTRPPRGRFLDLCPATGDPDTMPRREEPSHGLLDPVAKMLRLPFSTPEFIDRIVTGGSTR